MLQTVKEYGKLFWDFLKKNFVFIILFVAYVCVTYFCHLQTCLVKLAIGYPCPGCGLSRALFSLLSLDIVGAFNYNPLIFITPILLWIIIFHKRPLIAKIYDCKILWLIVLLLTLGVYITRFVLIYPNPPMEYYDKNLLKWIIDTIRGWFK